MSILRTVVLTVIGIALVTATLATLSGQSSLMHSGQAPMGGIPTDATTAVPAQTSAVAMKNIAFSPSDLRVAAGTTVTWTNMDPMGHTVTPTDTAAWGSPGSGDAPAAWMSEGGTWSFTFDKAGSYAFYCLPHASKGADGTWAGMTGKVIVTENGADANAGSLATFQMPDVSVVPNPMAPGRALPDADGIVRLTLETREMTAKLADGVAYTFWTFGGTVPGPMVRVREGDQVEVTLKNDRTSTMSHSVDFHAVTGPGGGAKATQTAPGTSTSFTFRALAPGVYVYHCATPHIPSHVANGMYGLIVVEPKEGWPPVDREFYVMESEWYTTSARGQKGLPSLDIEKLTHESPEYFTFNGQVGALTGEGSMRANVGETVRIFFGVGGGVPSSVHMIGEIFDSVYMDGNAPAMLHRQTVLIPAAGSAILDLSLDVPGDYILVDHTLTRAIDGGAAGILHVEGASAPEVYEAGPSTSQESDRAP